MTSPVASSRYAHHAKLGPCLLAAIYYWSVAPPAMAAETTRAEKIAAELNVPRRAWTICTVNEVGSAVQAGRADDPTSIADTALTRCSVEEQALHAKAVELLGDVAAGHLVQRLEAEARDALIGSARTLLSAKASADVVDPAWPRTLAPAR